MLDPILNQAMRTQTGAFRSSPISSLTVASGLKPLSTYREIKTLNYYLRTAVNKTNPLYQQIQSDNELPRLAPTDEGESLERKTLLQRAEILMRKYNINLRTVREEDVPEYPPWVEGNLTVCQELDDCQKNQQSAHLLKGIFLEHLRSHQDSITLYTDGSKTDTGVGFAVVGGGCDISRRINGTASVFTAELLAILEAVEQSQRMVGEITTIITDSKSSIQAINRLYHDNPIVQEIKKAIRNSNKDVKLCWVPSHVGVPGNENADSSAREATTSPTIHRTPLPRSDIKCNIKQKAHTFWKQRWQQESPTNKLREITATTSLLPNSSCADREWERGLVRLRIGHCHLTHSHLMAGGQPPECEDCNTIVTVKHIILECPSFENQRRRFFPNYRADMKYFLNEADTSYGGPLYSFVKEINLLNNL